MIRGIRAITFVALAAGLVGAAAVAGGFGILEALAGMGAEAFGGLAAVLGEMADEARDGALAR